jgi:hypothetical protein
MRVNRKRSGVVLVGVLAVMGLIAGVMTVLAHSSIGLHESRKHAAIERAACLMAESGVAYTKAHEEAWRAAVPTTPVLPDVRTILPPRMTGKLEISVEQTDGGVLCRIKSRVEQKGFAVTETRDVVLE